MTIVGMILTVMMTWPADALVNCGPSSCSPACDSSCSYRVCAGSATNVFTIDKLPYTYVTPSNACEDRLSGKVFSVLPIHEDDVEMTKMSPTQVRHAYKICETRTNSGPACPPPPKEP